MNIVIAVDHGNKQVKTVHHTFTSGLEESFSPPALGGKAIKYAGKFYSLSESRIPYMRDKTTDERFFVLTLFAIFQEIEEAEERMSDNEVEVTLLTGLPPAHYGAQKGAFIKYFTGRGTINCTYNRRPHNVKITAVRCYPQGYAAAMVQYDEILTCPCCRVIDIGGYTVDYLQILKGSPDISVCGSLELGVIPFYNRVRAEINSSFDLLVEESDIDTMMEGKGRFPQKVVNYVLQASKRYVEDIIHQFRERGIDFGIGTTMFVGGGSSLFQQHIERIGGAADIRFVGNVNANVRGYELLYEAQCKSK